MLKSREQFLLLERKNPPNKGTYTPVGGKLQPFEDPVQAAIRETREETGIHLSGVRYCGSLVESSPTKYNWVCFVYLAEIAPVEPPPCNEGVLTWIPIDRLPGVPTPPTDRFIYEYLLAGKPFAFNAEYDEQLNLLNMSEEFENIVVYRRSE